MSKLEEYRKALSAATSESDDHELARLADAAIEQLTWMVNALIHLGNYYDMMGHEEIIADLERRWAERGGE